MIRWISTTRSGREKMLASVNMRTERNSFSFIFLVLDNENLITTAIGQNGFVPAIKFVQTTCLLQDFSAWSKIQMVRVPKDNLCFNFLV